VYLVNQIVLFFLCLCCLQTQAQKKLITNESYRTWVYLYPDYNISNNGCALWYRYGAPLTGDILVLQSSFKKEFPKGFQPVFTADNQWLYFRLPGNVLVKQSTVDTFKQLIPDVLNYTLIGNTLILQTSAALIYQGLCERTTIYHGIADTYVLDETGTQLAFIVNGALYYYRAGMDSSILLQRAVTGTLLFRGTRLYFQRPTDNIPKTIDSVSEVTYSVSEATYSASEVTYSIPEAIPRIWHYDDYYLPTQQVSVSNAIMAIDLLSKEVSRLDSPGTEICAYGEKYVLAQNNINATEYYWNKSVISTLYLVYNGTYKIIRQNKETPIIHVQFSPDERFVSWYENQYYRYEIATAEITKGEPVVNEMWPFTEQPFTKWPFTKLPFTGPYLYYYPKYPLDQYKPVKARDTTLYLVQRMSDRESPNLFTTSDFKSFRRITDFSPEKSYNWMQASSIKNGILYKPENFDPTKKYPLIFHYYEISSDQLYLFRKPTLSYGALDIAWYVSNGYLVFIPDIKRPKGHPGKGALSVIHAAKYFRKLPWVGKMGLQGHSFGGYITNYLITHSNLFAAAQESAGPVDFISGYGAVKKHTGNVMQYLYERGQNNMGATPWQRQDLYLKNSPILRADKITTPLLILHNEEDNAVPAEQGIALFTALRRLQKPAWLLQYDGEGHMLINEQHKLDFSRRQQQFFDHYLKGKPVPDWMKNQRIPFPD
jgi:dienelactone hydrolase